MEGIKYFLVAKLYLLSDWIGNKTGKAAGTGEV